MNDTTSNDTTNTTNDTNDESYIVTYWTNQQSIDAPSDLIFPLVYKGDKQNRKITCVISELFSLDVLSPSLKQWVIDQACSEWHKLFIRHTNDQLHETGKSKYPNKLLASDFEKFVADEKVKKATTNIVLSKKLIEDWFVVVSDPIIEAYVAKGATDKQVANQLKKDKALMISLANKQASYTDKQVTKLDKLFELLPNSSEMATAIRNAWDKYKQSLLEAEQENDDLDL